jgi:uncharacterized protein (TIGR02594 family)
MSQVVIPTSNIQSPIRSLTPNDALPFEAASRQSKFTGASFGDIAGEFDPGVGYYGGFGGSSGEGNFIRQSPSDVLPEGEGFSALNSILEQTLAASTSWSENGSNPNILQTYRVCGFNYTSDQTPWCAGYVSWVLETAGIQNPRSLGSQVYARYGAEVDWRTWEEVRPNDIVVFRSRTRSGGHVGFFRGYNPNTNRVAILGGNQANTVKISNFSVSGDLMVINVKRNWAVPPEFDFPIIGNDVASGSLESYASTR